MEKNVNLDLSKAFCEDCLVNLKQTITETANRSVIKYVCPKCKKEWIIEFDSNGEIINSSVTYETKT
jgi:Zn finger protein HypA/HybF involved in hydrogenase expression